MPVATTMTDTASAPSLATYACLPSGLNATPDGPCKTSIASFASFAELALASPSDAYGRWAVRADEDNEEIETLDVATWVFIYRASPACATHGPCALRNTGNKPNR